jgi:hypothetical protein
MTDHPNAVQLPIAVNPDRLGARRTAQLSEPERELYRAILRRFASGEVVRRADLETAARVAGLPVDAAMSRLEELDLVMRDGSTGDVRCAYPFSGTPSPHIVRLAGQEHAMHAMCAVDALGIPFMLRALATVTSADPRTGQEVRVHVDPGGDVRWEPTDAVVVAGGLASAGSASTLCCPIVNFFETRTSADAYLAERPDFDGAILSIPEAIMVSRAIFEEQLG